MAYILGVDGGIASVGWALLDDQEQCIVAAGTWCFDAPETPRRELLNAVRRHHCGQRRVIRRRRQRMAKLRHLFVQHGLLDEASRDALAHRAQCDPWMLRADALDSPLSAIELALALGHIARHRGFRSNSKRDRGTNAPTDTSVMLKAIAANTEHLEGRTVAQRAVSDVQWQDRKRNRSGDYTRTLLRQDLQDETCRIFDAQRGLNSIHATRALQDAYMPLAFDQRPLEASDGKVAFCAHERSERRTAKRAPSFELFRLLSRLRNLSLLTAAGPVNLTPEQVATVVDGFGKKQKLTFEQVRKRLDLSVGARFDGVSVAEEGRDVATRSGGAAEGTYALRQALGEAGWKALAPYPEKLDRAAEVLTFREDLQRIGEGLLETGMEPWCADLLTEAAKAGCFARFKGAAHISAKVSRAVNQSLRRGLPVHEAFAEAGYDHAARPATDLRDIANPTARKALSQMILQVRSVVHAYKHLFGTLGLPDRIHVELARDVGKGQEEREEIARGLERRTRTKEVLRRELSDLFPGYQPGGEDLLRYELWKEQGYTCPYTGEHIPPSGVLAADNTYQVDHILPWRRFADDSFRNKALVCAKANQDKRDRTPFEWLGGDAKGWLAFSARVENCKKISGGKRIGYYLRRNAAEVEQRFRTRNLNDTRYACRLLLDTLARWYPANERSTDSEDPKRHVFARPGALTSKLRQAWGLEGRKKRPDGTRLADDRHHALDAMIVAACSESMLQRLTNRVQENKAAGRHRPFAGMPEPWRGFREQAQAAVDRVFVARPERCRVSGEVHAATIRQVRERDAKLVVYERKPVEKLTLKDLDHVKDGADRNIPLVILLREWIERGKPKDAPPRSPKGDVVNKVRLKTTDKVAVLVRGGTADRGEMARVDVFCEYRSGKLPRFHLVPIYPHQIMDPKQIVAPSRAVVGNKNEDEWTSVGAFLFIFSLYNNSLIEVVKPDGEVLRGYRKGFDRNTANMDLADPISQQALHGFGPKTLTSFRKLTVDRLGKVFEVSQEVRTWHGVACI